MFVIEIDFLFEEEYKKIVNYTSLKFSHSKTKAISIPSLQQIFVRLNSNTWKLSFAISEDYFIEDITKTIIHEYVHLLVYDYKEKATYEGEERICRLLADQETFDQ